jgi:HTH-type transcriptional regulator/antitoxin HigA
MEIRPIKTDADYRSALRRIDELMDATADSDQGAELDVIATLVDAYENARFPIEAPNPVDAILFRVEQLGLTRKDLEPYLGSRSRVSEVLNRKRELSLGQIRKLHAGLSIPYESLLGDAERS